MHKICTIEATLRNKSKRHMRPGWLKAAGWQTADRWLLLCAVGWLTAARWLSQKAHDIVENIGLHVNVAGRAGPWL